MFSDRFGERGNAFLGGGDAEGAEATKKRCVLRRRRATVALWRGCIRTGAFWKGKRETGVRLLIGKGQRALMFSSEARRNEPYLLQSSVAQAWVGKFETADALFRKANDIGEKSITVRAAEIVFELKTLREGRPPPLLRRGPTHAPRRSRQRAAALRQAREAFGGPVLAAVPGLRVAA